MYFILIKDDSIEIQSNKIFIIKFRIIILSEKPLFLYCNSKLFPFHQLILNIALLPCDIFSINHHLSVLLVSQLVGIQFQFWELKFHLYHQCMI